MEVVKSNMLAIHLFCYISLGWWLELDCYRGSFATEDKTILTSLNAGFCNTWSSSVMTCDGQSTAFINLITISASLKNVHILMLQHTCHETNGRRNLSWSSSFAKSQECEETNGWINFDHEAKLAQKAKNVIRQIDGSIYKQKFNEKMTTPVVTISGWLGLWRLLARGVISRRLLTWHLKPIGQKTHCNI